MASYVVMEPPGRGEDAVLIRDGFTWLGLLFPPLWLAWHRLWLEAVLAAVAMALLSVAADRFGLGPAGDALSMLVSLYVGLEGQGLRVAALRRRGWLEWGVVEASSLADAEMRHALEAGASPESDVAPRPLTPDANLARAPQTGMALGLTHTPGRP